MYSNEVLHRHFAADVFVVMLHKVCGSPWAGRNGASCVTGDCWTVSERALFFESRTEGIFGNNFASAS
jgi:hypothetical protein